MFKPHSSRAKWNSSIGRTDIQVGYIGSLTMSAVGLKGKKEEDLTVDVRVL